DSRAGRVGGHVPRRGRRLRAAGSCIAFPIALRRGRGGAWL
ncbi:MAG: hypothetical protein AVDCRST_MAG69-914, partial [uncultured Solirubrobacteraceae bacterium]